MTQEAAYTWPGAWPGAASAPAPSYAHPYAYPYGTMTGAGGAAMPMPGAVAMNPTGNPAGDPTADPRVRAALQQALANPNGGDGFQKAPGGEEQESLMPRWQDAMVGGGVTLAGVTLANKALGEGDQRLLSGLQKLTQTRPVQAVDGFITRRVMDPLRGSSHASLKILAHGMAPEAMATHLAGQTIDLLHPDIRKFSPDLVQHIRSAALAGGNFNLEAADTEIRRIIANELTPEKLELHAFKQEASRISRGATGLWGRMARSVGMNGVDDALKTQIARADSVDEIQRLLAGAGLDKEAAEALGTAQKASTKLALRYRDHFNGLRNRLTGMHNHHFKEYEATYRMLQDADKLKNVGPVGRLLYGVKKQLMSIFSGDIMMGAGGHAAERTGLMGFMQAAMRRVKFLLPFGMGAITVGQSLTEAHKAEKGDKVATFFHDFLGFGIGQFVGWAVGRHLLNSINFSRWFAKIPVIGKPFKNVIPLTYKLAPRFLAKLPLVGGKLAGWLLKSTGPGKWITLGGLASELLAMFGFGWVFQKIFEKISHAIFGKPKKLEAEAAGVQQAKATAPTQPLRRPDFQAHFGPGTPGTVAGTVPAKPAVPAAPDPNRITVPIDEILENRARVNSEHLDSQIMAELAHEFPGLEH